MDGGAAVNDLLMQFQADVLGVPVVRPQVTETTALGAAYLAGLATGFWGSPEELLRNGKATCALSRRWMLVSGRSDAGDGDVPSSGAKGWGRVRSIREVGCAACW